MQNDPFQIQKAPDANASKRSLKRTILLIGGVLLGMILIAGSTVALLSFFNKKDSQQSADAQATITLPALQDGLRAALGNPTTLNSQIYKPNDPATVVHMSASKAWVQLDQGESAMTLSSAQDNASKNKAEYDAAIKYLSSVGFKEISASTPRASRYTADKTSVQYFALQSTSCTLHNYVEQAMYTLQTDCAQVSSFNKAAAAAKPFSEAYTTHAKDIVFGTPHIQTSGTKEYHTALVSVLELDAPTIESQTAFYYQTPDNSWHFLTTASDRDKVSCDTFSEDALNAFIGFTCWDTKANKSAFVSRPAPTFEIIPGSQG